ncbi:MAG: FAD-binding oxidoreductase [Rhodospirillales bacterium]|nr:FAD-binding oxidoreductase [Rhodospirillales bacterium]MDP6804457.1 FAD-binding oxidoreductase [Rhodospirillales bacterium]
MTFDTDVLVVGGGILGCCVAYFLAQEGVDVLVIDRHDVNYQASGSNAGSLHVQMESARAKRTDPVYVAAIDRSLAVFAEGVKAWQRLAPTLDRDVELRVGGGLMLAETETELRFLEAKTKRERAQGLAVDVITAAEVRAIAPYLSERVIGAAYCPQEGKINPGIATPSLVRSAERLGARFRRQCELLALSPETGGFTATTRQGTIRCHRVVNAAGSWANAVADMVGIHLPTSRRPLHMNVTEATAPLVGHLIQHASRRLTAKQAEAGNVIIGGAWPASLHAITGEPAVLRATTESNLWVAQQLIPALGHLRLMRTWTAFNITMNDANPILGEVPRVPGFFMAVPANSGYTNGPIYGQLVAEAVRGKDPSFDISGFSIERFPERPS